MLKRSLTDSKMSDVYVEQAVRWSKELTRMRSRGPGDIENAMRSIERDYGIDYWTVWQLRYRPTRIKDIGVSIYTRLRAAYETERARQIRRLQHDIEITKATVPHCDLLDEAAAMVGTEDGVSDE